MSGVTIGAPIVHGPVPIGSQTRDQNYLDTYANQLRIGATLTDITIVFGIVEDLAPSHFVNKDKVAVHLAPGTLKLLVANLQAVLEII